MKIHYLFITIALFHFIVYSAETEAFPKFVDNYLSNYCLECHDHETQKGDMDLDRLSMDWNNPTSLDLWEHVLWINEDGLMPPEDKKQPSQEERLKFIDWVKSKTLQHQTIGGTLPRRLNQKEYENSIRDLFDDPSFQLPAGFPRDSVYHGFNNMGEGLKLSPPLLEVYHQVAADMAEKLFPRKQDKPSSHKHVATPEDMVISFSAATVRNGALRLASKSDSTMRGSTWPSRIEILHSGRYKIQIQASKYLPVSSEDMILEVRARELSTSDRANVKTFRHLIDIPVKSGSPETTNFEAKLYEGQTLLFRWKNAEMDHEYNALADLFEERFKTEKRFHAAWLEVMYHKDGKKKVNHTILRGRNGYDRVKAAMADENLDLSTAHQDSPQHKAFMKFARSMQATMSIADTLAFDYFEHGPALELHEVVVEGPIELVEGPKDKRRYQVREHCFGKRKDGQSDLDYTKDAIRNFTSKAFRRPVSDDLVHNYHQQFKHNLESGLSIDECYHLLIRNILVSPRFLFRSLKEGELDNYDLATRLSYFFTQSPPDSQLRSLASQGKLKDPQIFREEIQRLMPKNLTQKHISKSSHHPLVEDFVTQWLHLHSLKEIMPAPSFNFSEKRKEWAKNETLHFFQAMLSENRVMTDFIDPDFTFSTEYFFKNHYKEEAYSTVKTKEQSMQRLAIQRGGRHGGLIGQASIMIATANGVDTQPVERGVWMMENILGQKVPPPPKSVPALTPDVNSSSTPRDLLAQHTKDPSCISCHKQMDPLGLVLENFDPVGKWRETWPKVKKKINPSITLKDGTQLKNFLEFKQYLKQNIDLFTQCLSEKILTYATGRELNYRERAEIAKIVKANHQKGNKFKDLFYDLLDSSIFRTK